VPHCTKLERFSGTPLNDPLRNAALAVAHIVRFRTATGSIPFERVPETRRFRDIPFKERFRGSSRASGLRDVNTPDRASGRLRFHGRLGIVTEGNLFDSLIRSQYAWHWLGQRR
jgi:hypothetical protein